MSYKIIRVTYTKTEEWSKSMKVGEGEDSSL